MVQGHSTSALSSSRLQICLPPQLQSDFPLLLRQPSTLNRNTVRHANPIFGHTVQGHVGCCSLAGQSAVFLRFGEMAVTGAQGVMASSLRPRSRSRTSARKSVLDTKERQDGAKAGADDGQGGFRLRSSFRPQLECLNLLAEAIRKHVFCSNLCGLTYM